MLPKFERHNKHSEFSAYATVLYRMERLAIWGFYSIESVVETTGEKTMSTKTVKVVGWQPQQAPPKQECQAMIQIVNEAVMSLYNESKLPLQTFACDLQQIYRRCQQKVRQLRANGTWNYPYRGKRTWDRRVNEAASTEHGAKIVAVTAGKYRPNPRLFQET